MFYEAVKNWIAGAVPHRTRFRATLSLTARVATLLATITVLGCGTLREDIIKVDAADEGHSTGLG